MHVNVVNSYAAAMLSVPVSLVNSVDFPTLGNPINATRASPDFITSKPSPVLPPLDVLRDKSSCRYRASFAFNSPKWNSVAFRLKRLANTFVLLCTRNFLFYLCNLFYDSHYPKDVSPCYFNFISSSLAARHLVL